MESKTKQKLRRFAEFVKSIPRKNFDMGDWNSNITGDKLTQKNIEHCDTHCCLAGWQALRKGYTLQGSLVYKNNTYEGRILKVAQDTLGLDEYEANALFLPGSWPKKANGQDRFQPTPKGAAKRILHLVKKGE